VNTAGNPAVLYIYYNPIVTNYLRWTTQTDFNASLFASRDSSGLFTLPAQTTPPIAAFHMTDGSTIDDIPPNNFITAAVQSTSNLSDATVSFIYVED
jgi:hypothetical protein